MNAYDQNFSEFDYKLRCPAFESKPDLRVNAKIALELSKIETITKLLKTNLEQIEEVYSIYDSVDFRGSEYAFKLSSTISALEGLLEDIPYFHDYHHYVKTNGVWFKSEQHPDFE